MQLTAIGVVLCALAVIAAKRKIPVGGLFHADNPDSEIAFRHALRRVNMYSPRLEFVPIVHWLDATDSYQAERAACALAADGVAAIFGPSSTQTSGIVASVCQNLGIPHMLAHWQPDEMMSPPPPIDDEQEDADKDHRTDDDDDDEEEDADAPPVVVQPKHHTHTRNFFPDRNLYADVLGKLIEDSDFAGFTLIYDTSDRLERLQDVLQIHEPSSPPITVRQLPPGDPNVTDYKPLLKEIHMTGGDAYIMLDCEPAQVMGVLQQAAKVKLLKAYQRYIITSLDAHVLRFSELQFENANITTIRMMDQNSPEVMMAVQDWRKGETERLSSAVYSGLYDDRVRTEAALINDAVKHFATSLQLYHEHTREVQPRSLRCEGAKRNGRWEQGRQILATMDRRLNMTGMTGRTLFDANGRRSDFYLEMLELKTDATFKRIATWDLTEGLVYTRSSNEKYSEIQQTLQNRIVKVVMRPFKPWLMLKPQVDGVYRMGNDRYEGFGMDLIEAIANFLNFKYEVELVKDEQNGSYDKKTKKWNGMIRELLDRRADLAICDLSITSERRKAVDFTMPIMNLGISILFLKPKKEPPGWFSFLNPLSPEVWAYMMTTYLLVSVVLFVAAKISADDWENPHPCDDDPEELENLWNMHNCMWLTVGAIMQQGCDLLPKAVPTRLVVSFWWFFALIVTSSYTANLAAFLTKEQMEGSLSSAEDLVKQTTIKYGVMKGGSTLSFFKDSNFSTYQKMWAVMETDPTVFVQTNEEGVDRVLRGNNKYAFLCESTSIDYESNRNPKLTQVGGLLDSKNYGIAMQMNSPFRTHLDNAILKMAENGRLIEMKKKWWEVKKEGDDAKENDVKEPEEEEKADGLSMRNVGGVFFVLVVGCCVGLLIGVFEFLWNLRHVAIENKITQKEAFFMELRFAIDLRKTSKPVHIDAGSTVADASRNDDHNLSDSGDDQSSLSLRSYGADRDVNGKSTVNNNHHRRASSGSFRHLNSI